MMGSIVCPVRIEGHGCGIGFFSKCGSLESGGIRKRFASWKVESDKFILDN